MDTLELKLQLLTLMQDRQTNLWSIGFELSLLQEPGYFSRNIQEVERIQLDNDQTDEEILNYFNL